MAGTIADNEAHELFLDELSETEDRQRQVRAQFETATAGLDNADELRRLWREMTDLTFYAGEVRARARAAKGLEHNFRYLKA